MEKYSAHLIDAGLTFIDNAVLMHGFDNTLVKRLSAIPTFKGLGELALEMVDKRGSRFAYVSGRMRSGPLGYIGNAREIDKLCTWLVKPEEGHGFMTPVFYQLVFQIEIHRIRERDYKTNDDLFIRDLCEHFAKPIIQHPLLHRFIRMPNADDSIGARHEFRIFRARHDSSNVSVQEIDWPACLERAWSPCE